jgi:signal transduction histidine kinase
VALTPARLFRIALWPVGFVFGLGAVTTLGRFGDKGDAQLVSDLLGGWAFMAAGLVVWARLPDRRLGPISVAVGFAWFVGSYAPTASPVVRYLAEGFRGWFDPLIAALALAYPSGHVRPRAGRVVVATWLATLAAWTITRLALGVPLAWYPCPACPASADAWVWSQSILDALGPVFGLLSTACAAATVVVLLHRVATATPVGRRRLAPVALAAVLIGVGLVVVDAERALRVGALTGVVTTPLLNTLSILVAAAMLAGLLGEQSSRSAIADAVGALGTSPSGGAASTAALRAALATALGDASLRVLTWDRGSATYRDEQGGPALAPEEDDRRVVMRLGEGDPPTGLVIHDAALRDDPGLASAVRAAVRLHVENARLEGEVRAQLADVQASRSRLVSAGDRERRRLERDLHDGAQQRLVGLALDVRRAQSRLDAGSDPELAGALADASEDISLAIEELRELARGIHPSILGESGLGAALESLAARSRIPVVVEEALGAARFDPAVEATAYFVVAEGLTNAAKASGASCVRLRATRTGDVLTVELSDDGAGGADPDRGTGLRGLDDRVTAVGGRLTVDSRVGMGTTLIAELPIHA